ncbi:hypothetical protein M2480_002546 [Parabacteroides sp. PFB2-12]|uniref:glycosyl hydrolase n=1 Tax=unclassified Parabacteroides TaxID=2649774 RepID=UPI002476D57C|nr:MULTISPECIES: glycosyl hydrolase [unclassified Parabacteroides]MDH6344104.1 hypothetical protein [Parabacteroides sp. PM6-13]MDH6391551.1 hypothetical protein [Parabacteroides sp. PFB2-12]
MKRLLKKAIGLTLSAFCILGMALFMLQCTAAPANQAKETGEIRWPEITQETKPWTRWWWQGSAVSEKGLTYMLDTYQKAGLGGVEITPIYGVRGAEAQDIPYLSPEWMEKFTYTLQEAKRLDLGVDLANAPGWPFGGPWVDREIESKYMASQTYEVKGGSQWKQAIQYQQEPILRVQGRVRPSIDEIKKPVTANENLQEYAFDQVRYPEELPLILVTANKKGDNGYTETIDLTDQVKEGVLTWEAPAGDWVVCALFQGYHGKMVERAAPGGEGHVIDHFSAEALHKYMEPFEKAFQGHDLSYLRYFFNDSYEVDDAVGESNWTPKFLEEFEQLNGYDLRQFIPALLGKDNEETNNRVMYDYRATISELLLERYTKEWQKWAARQGKGIRNQAHGSPANVLDLYAASDVPEIEGGNIVDLKSAPSAAHVTGKNLISCESVTWLNEHFQSTLGDMKWAIDKFFLAGVNHIFYHGTPYTPQEAPWPGWLFYAAVDLTPNNSIWDDFGTLNEYVARAQSFLQAGKPSNDILLYFSIADLWSERGRSTLQHFHSGRFFNEVSLKACGDFLTENGYSWDAITDKQLQNTTADRAGIHTGGNTYKTILIPETHYIPLETFEKLTELAKNGATILFYKGLPSEVPGLANLEEKQKKLQEGIATIAFQNKHNISSASFGKGKIMASDHIADLVKSAGVAPESMYASGLMCIRRLKEDGNFYYYVINPTENEYEGWIALNADYASAALYNLMRGTDGYAQTRQKDGKTEFYLRLQPGESFVVETYRNKLAGDLYLFYQPAGEAIALTGNWTVEFVKGGPTLPAKKTVETLGSWTEYGAEYAAFSGTATYSTTLPALEATCDAWLLDLGDVDESVAIYLNDNHIATLIRAPFQIEIPAELLKGDDKLSVKVSNLMANRIADMDKKGIEWRIFYNTNFNARLRENTGADGKFTAKNWAPKSSGLLGPVTITPQTKP